MKTNALTIAVVLLALALFQPVCSQEKPVDNIRKKSQKVMNRQIDKSFNKLFGKEEPKEVEQPAQNQEQASAASEEKPQTGASEAVPVDGSKVKDVKPELKWSKYDFVPGDKIIFEDNLEGEENGEFPSRWDLMAGNVEVAEFDGSNVIMFRDGAPQIIPYFKEAKEDYLPDVFTIEFDLYCGTSDFVLYLYDRKNQKSGSPTGYTDLQIDYKRMDFGQSSSRHPDESKLEKRRWIHVSVAYTNGKLKAYMDETRLINIPRIDFDPKGITLHSYHARNDYLYYVKNIRIAEGGVKYYDRIMQDGKIIANGIRFDVGLATLKPESMGVINEIYGLMEKNPDLNFSVEGHTDSQGDEDFNMQLSKERAETVMKTLIEMGISDDRLEAKGWGESKPIANNASPEDMANNRRVEFVKI